MKIGFIGAGRVGYSLSKYLSIKYHNVVGIYSKNLDDSIDLASFCSIEYHEELIDLVNSCDTLFLTVCDDSIKDAANELLKLNTSGKTIIHTSGCHTSDIFGELLINNRCFSMHPIYAFSDKYESYKNLDDIYFTIEGNSNPDDLINLFPNRVNIIKKDKKTLYHAGCVMISNLVCGLMHSGENIFKDLNLNLEMFKPLILNNISNILDSGSVNALTGPVIRNDIKTVEKHLLNLNGREKEIYKLLSMELVDMSENKNAGEYSQIKELLERM